MARRYSQFDGHQRHEEGGVGCLRGSEKLVRPSLGLIRSLPRWSTLPRAVAPVCSRSVRRWHSSRIYLSTHMSILLLTFLVLLVGSVTYRLFDRLVRPVRLFVACLLMVCLAAFILQSREIFQLVKSPNTLGFPTFFR